MSYTIAKHADQDWSIDSQSYLKMAMGDFEVTSTHRYRPVVPLLSGLLANLIQQPANILWPQKELDQERILRYAFVLVNALFYSLALSLMVWSSFQLHQHLMASVVVLLALCSSRWTIYMVGIPLTDSFYLLSLSLLWIGLIHQSFPMVLISFLLGPVAKETYPLFFVVMLLPQASFISWTKKLLLLGSSLGIWVGLRYGIDLAFGPPIESSTENLMVHLQLLPENLSSLLSPNGIAQLLGTFGLFSLLFLLPFVQRKKYFQNQEFKNRLSQNSALLIIWIAIIFIHVVLSGDFSRMMFFAAPALMWLVSEIVSKQVPLKI